MCHGHHNYLMPGSCPIEVTSRKRCGALPLQVCEVAFTESDVTDLLGLSRETVGRWWSAYTAGGVPALPQDRTEDPLGSGRLLSDEPTSYILQRLDANSPEDLGIASPLWSRRAVRCRLVGSLIRWRPQVLQ